MKLKEIKKIVRDVLKEVNTVGAGGSSFTAGEGMQYSTPKAFKGAPFVKKTKRPKRPSHTKMFDYL